MKMRLCWLLFLLGVTVDTVIPQGTKNGNPAERPANLPPTATKRGSRPARLDSRVAFQRFVKSKGGRLAKPNSDVFPGTSGGWRHSNYIPQQYNPFPVSKQFNDRPLSHPAILERPKSEQVDIPASRPAVRNKKTHRNKVVKSKEILPTHRNQQGPRGTKPQPAVNSQPVQPRNKDLNLHPVSATKRGPTPNNLPIQKHVAGSTQNGQPGKTAPGNTAGNTGNKAGIDTQKSVASGRNQASVINTAATSTKMSLADSFKKLHEALAALKSQSLSQATQSNTTTIPLTVTPSSSLKDSKALHDKSKTLTISSGSQVAVTATKDNGLNSIDTVRAHSLPVVKKPLVRTNQQVPVRNAEASPYGMVSNSNRMQNTNVNGQTFNTVSVTFNKPKVSRNKNNNIITNSKNAGNNYNGKTASGARTYSESTSGQRSVFGSKGYASSRIIGTGRTGRVSRPSPRTSVPMVHPPVLTRSEVRSDEPSYKTNNGASSRRQGLSGTYSSYNAYPDSKANTVGNFGRTVSSVGTKDTIQRLVNPLQSGIVKPNSAIDQNTENTNAQGTSFESEVSHSSKTSVTSGSSWSSRTSVSSAVSDTAVGASSQVFSSSLSNAQKSGLQNINAASGSTPDLYGSQVSGSQSSASSVAQSSLQAARFVSDEPGSTSKGSGASQLHSGAQSQSRFGSQTSGLSSGSSRIVSQSSSVTSQTSASASMSSSSASQTGNTKIQNADTQSQGTGLDQQGSQSKSQDGKYSSQASISHEDTSSTSSLTSESTSSSSQQSVSISQNTGSMSQGVSTMSEGSGSATKSIPKTGPGQDSSNTPVTADIPTPGPPAKQRSGGPIKEPCKIAPICGSDGFTYMSQCFLSVGIAKACDGFCPCQPSPAPVSQPGPSAAVSTNQGKPQPSQPTPRPLVRPPSLGRRPVGLKPPPSALGRGSFTASIGSQTSDAAATNVAGCTCPQHYDPVCGINGQTYGNDCTRRCAGITKSCGGLCPCKQRPSAALPNNQGNQQRPLSRQPSLRRRPVGLKPPPSALGRGSFTASIGSQISDAAATNVAGCTCPQHYDPVCGINGQTYGNDCTRRCAYVGLECQGTCPCVEGRARFAPTEARPKAIRLFTPNEKPTKPIVNPSKVIIHRNTASAVKGLHSTNDTTKTGVKESTVVITNIPAKKSSSRTGTNNTYTAYTSNSNTAVANKGSERAVIHVSLGASLHSRGQSNNTSVSQTGIPNTVPSIESVAIPSNFERNKSIVTNTNEAHGIVTKNDHIKLNASSVDLNNTAVLTTSRRPKPERETAEIVPRKKIIRQTQRGIKQRNSGITKTKRGSKPPRPEKEPVEREVIDQEISGGSAPASGHTSSSYQDPFSWMMFDSTGLACMCPYEYAPICGTNGVTYNNYCSLSCDRVPEDCTGECPCQYHEPVPSPAQATASGSGNSAAQPFTCSDYCPTDYSPVCSTWGHTFENDCVRDCSGEPFDCHGSCPCPNNVYNNQPQPTNGPAYQTAHQPNTGYDVNVHPDVNNEPSNQPVSTCNCGPGDIDPVCTTDGRTLWYGCMAICQGATIACSSECPC